MVASRNLKAGELIFREKAAATGPKNGSKPVCLSCYAVINKDNARHCPGCNFPFCSQKCTEVSTPHMIPKSIHYKQWFIEDCLLLKNEIESRPQRGMQDTQPGQGPHPFRWLRQRISRLWLHPYPAMPSAQRKSSQRLWSMYNSSLSARVQHKVLVWKKK